MSTATRNWPQVVRLAINAHRSGVVWDSFWPTVAADCRRLQAACPTSHRSLYGRLLSIVVAGDEDGVEVFPDPLTLDQDENVKLPDAGTAARIDWEAAGLSGPPTRGPMRGSLPPLRVG